MSFGMLHQLLCLSWETQACSAAVALLNLAAVTLLIFGCGSPASSEMMACVASFHQQFVAAKRAIALGLTSLATRVTCRGDSSGLGFQSLPSFVPHLYDTLPS